MHKPLPELLADHQPGHSEFQMDCFITGAHGCTVYGRYKQSLRELASRYRNAQSAEHELSLLRFNSQQWHVLSWLLRLVVVWPWFYRWAKLKHRACLLAIEGIEQSLQSTRREFEHFHKQASELKRHVGELTPERRAELDHEEWMHRVLKMVAIDKVANGGVSRGTVEHLSAYPREDIAVILSRVNELSDACHILGLPQPEYAETNNGRLRAVESA